MTIPNVLCANNTHVYRAGSNRCDCGAQANNAPIVGYTYPEILERYFPNQMDICPVCDRPEIEHTVHPNGDTQCPIRLPDFSTTAATPQIMPDVPNPHHPRYVPPVAEPEIPASVKAKAVEAGASHLSADGLTAYKWLFGKVYKADWLRDAFGVWWATGEETMPSGVVELDG